jgi:hypothetical protein
VFRKTDAGVVETDVAPGAYVVTVERASDGLSGETKLDARAAGARTVTIPLELDLRATLTVTPSEAAAASKVSVAWQGPGRSGDYVTVVKPGAPARLTSIPTAATRRHPLPGEPGDYEMRYVLERRGSWHRRSSEHRRLLTVPVNARQRCRSKMGGPTTRAIGSPS